WPPEHDRRETVALDQHPQRPSRAEEVLLAEHLVERPGSQPRGQRRTPFEAFGDRGGEEVVGHTQMLPGPPRPGTWRRSAVAVSERCGSCVVLSPAVTDVPPRYVGFLQRGVNLPRCSGVFFPWQ